MNYHPHFGGRHWYQGHIDNEGMSATDWYRFGIVAALIVLLVVVFVNEKWVLG